MQMEMEQKIAFALALGTLVMLVLLGLTVVASQVDCPSYKPLYSQPGLVLVYNISVTQGTYNESQLRTETVISRNLGNYTARILVVNTTVGANPMIPLFNDTSVYRIDEGLGMEEIPLYDVMLPMGIEEFSVSGMKFLGTRYYDPNSGAIITIDQNTGIILKIAYSGMSYEYTATLIRIDGGSWCNAW
ncbi:MAG: hypothetical protein RXO29_03090 [Desulfurococcales archaeon]